MMTSSTKMAMDSTNADEIDNGTDPCSGGSQPPDNDGDGTSDLNDNDDDNDGLDDTVDVFQLDPDNGTSTSLPVVRNLFADIASPPSFFGTGFSGIMANGTDYLGLIDDVDTGNGDARQIIAGGTAGLFTDTEVGEGDAHQGNNTQMNAFQFGVDVDNNTPPFTVRSRVLGPFLGAAGNFASQGIYIGTGDQDNFMKFVVNDGNGNPGTGGFEFGFENAGTANNTGFNVPGAMGETYIDLYLSVDPSTGIVTASYVLESDPTNVVTLGTTKTAAGDLLAAMQGTHTVGGQSSALAVGMIATSFNVALPFTATWDFFTITEDSDPELNVTPGAGLDFGDVQTGDSSIPTAITLTHTGGALSAPIDVTAVSIVGPDAAEFSSDFGGTITLNPGESETVDVTFSPTSVASKTAAIEFTHDGVNASPQSVSLTGEGVPIPTTILCINAGGPAVPTTSIGESFVAGDDGTYDNGSTYTPGTPAIGGTTDDVLFQTERYAGNLQFDIPVPSPGDYTVDLYFAEVFFSTAGERVFDINLEGSTVLADYDIFADVGQNEATTKQFTTTTADSKIDVDFVASENNGKVSAICVSQEPEPNDPPVVSGILDQSFFEGDDVSNAGLFITATDTDTLGYSATGLPPGVSVEPTNGQFLGTIDPGASANSPYTVVASVDDGVNAPVTTQFDWTVNALALQDVVCVNAGGGAIATTSLGRSFVADSATYYDVVGNTTNSGQTIAGTSDQELFKTERWNANLAYSIPVPSPGEYTVDLYFSETYVGAPGGGSGLGVGARLFDIVLEGTTVLSDYDIFAEVGTLTATSKQYVTTTADTEINIGFPASANNGKVNGICVSQVNAAPSVSPIADQSSLEGDDITAESLSVVATDADTLAYSATGLPAGITLDATTGQFLGTIAPGAGQANPYVVVVSVDDGVNVPAEVTFQWTVTPVEVTIDSPADGATVTTNDPTITWSTTGLPTNQGDHIHLYVDTDVYELRISPLALSGSESFSTLTGRVLPDGPHTIIMRPADTTHDEYPGVEDRIDFVVDAGSTVLHRVNAGGPLLSAADGSSPDWDQDEGGETSPDKSPYLVDGSNYGISTHNVAIDLTDESITSGPAPEALFQKERWDNPTSPAMAWAFPVTAGTTVEVRLYLAETYDAAQNATGRFFDVDVEGVVPAIYDDIAPFVLTGAADKAIMLPYQLVAPDDTLNLEFLHGAAENPAVKGIEIIELGDETPMPAALIQVNAGEDIDGSTFTGGSFVIENTGDQDIVGMSFDLSTASFPDMVFDPNGNAGDAVAKCLEPSAGVSATTGYVVPANECADPFSGFHNGVDDVDGFDVLSGTFTDFNPGETFSFAVDVDPTSIKNDQTAGDAGSVSGLELTGATVTIDFADGSTIVTTLFDEGSLGGSAAVAAPSAPAAPVIDMPGRTLNGIVTTAAQDVVITGEPLADVTLMQIDAHLYLDAGLFPFPGYDLDPLEANSALAKVLYTGQLDAAGTLTIPVTLLQSPGTPPAPDGGINHFVAVVEGSGDQNSLNSNTIVVELDPNAANQPPEVIIVVPPDNTIGDVDTPLTFEAASLDNEEGELTSSIVWTSDVDGPLGTGGSITTPLSEGPHVITAEVTDNDIVPLTGSDSITVFIADVEIVPNVLFRVNAGGPQIAAADASAPDWSADQNNFPDGANSPYLTGNKTDGSIYTGGSGSAHPGPIDMSDPSIPPSAPSDLFNVERFSNFATPQTWEFPVTTTNPVEVRLFFAELFSGVDASGIRQIDVSIEDVVPASMDDIDQFAIAGPKGAFMRSHVLTVTDGILDIDLVGTIAGQGPAVKGIEIIELVPEFENIAPGVTTPEPQDSMEGDVILLPIEAVGPEAADTLGFGATGLPSGLTIDPVTGEISGTIDLGAAALSPYTVEVTVTDDGDPAKNTVISFDWSVAASMPGALVEVTPGEDLDSSTFAGGDSFIITNNSPDGLSLITNVTIDLSTGVLPDMVFDPTGAGGDATAECFTPDVALGTATGLVLPTDICVDPFSVPRNGGFDVMSIDFTDFAPGEMFTFSTDIDPNSIQDVPGAGNAGSVSGYEILGATVSVTFDDGTVLVSSLYEDGSLGGSQAVLAPSAPIAPSIEVVGIGTGPATVTDATQVVTVTGTPGDEVSLLVMDSRLYIASGEAPFGVVDTTYYANEAMAGKTLYTATIGAGGTVDVPITLLQTASGDGTPDGGLNQIVAVSSLAPYAVDTQVSQTSNVVTLALGAGAALVEITPSGGLGASTFGDDSFQITNTSVGGIMIDSVEIDLGTAVLPDMVFDPTGAGGDATAGCFTPNSGDVLVGLVAPTDPCVDPFSVPRNGGFDVLTVDFTNFAAGESFTFTTDVDPNSIQGVPGAGNAGSVSGFELVGASVTVTFSDGSTVVSSLYEDGSLGGAQAIVAPLAPIAPSIEVVGVGTGPATVNDPAQTVTVTGTPGDEVSLLVMDSRLFIASGEAPFGVVDPTYYANEAMAKALYTATIGAGGTVDVPITLLETESGDGTPDGGLNQIVAVSSATPYVTDMQVSQTSNVVTLALGAGSALVEVTPGGVLGASTFSDDSFQITNTSVGGITIDSVEIDLSTAALPDMVFDPTGAGGDALASCFTPNSGATDVGLVAPADPCVDPFSVPRNGGFDVLTVDFTNFAAGESFTFTTDVDPNSIQGVAGAGNAGAVSGFELVGATVTVTFSDGSTVVSSLYEDGSLGGAQAVVAPLAPAAPSIEVVGVGAGPATVFDPAQVVTVTGTPGDEVSLLVMDSRLFIASGDAPFGVVDPTYYANEAMAKTLYTATIGGGGTVNIPVTLIQTPGAAGTPGGGLNQIVAVSSATPYVTDMHVSETSNVVTLLLGDASAPVISLLGDNPLEIVVGDPYVEPGATALDDVDGDISANIVIDASAVNTAVEDSYTVTYNVSDAAGNPAAEVTRTVNVVAAPDTTPPVITLVGDDPLEVALGDPYVEPGASALDDVDGDISANIVIDASAVNTAVEDSYTVTYNVSDAAGNPAVEVTRTVTVTVGPDTSPPVVTLTDPSGAVGAGPVDITGSVSDQSSLAWTYTVLQNTGTGEYWNGAAWQSSWAWFFTPTDGLGMFDSSVTLSVGSYRVLVYSRDSVGLTGNSGNVYFAVSAGVDTSPPVVTLTDPSGAVGAGPVDITGSVSDQSSLAWTYTVLQNTGTGEYWNGAAWQSSWAWFFTPTDGLGMFDSSVTLSVGSYRVLVYSRDSVGLTGNSGNVYFAVSAGVDTSPPVVTLTDPSGAVGAGPVDITGSVSDQSSLAWTYTVLQNTGTGEYWNGAAWQSSWAWFFTPTDGLGMFDSSVTLSVGSYRVLVYSRDSVGLTGNSGNVYFAVDPA